MSKHPVLILFYCLLMLLPQSGCIFFGAPEDLSDQFQGDYYQQKSTEVAWPDVDQPRAQEAEFASKPHTIDDRHKDVVWDITLEDALHYALSNNKILRTVSGQTPNNRILTNPEGIPTVYDQAIQESGVLFGRFGVEAALAAFDTQFTSSLVWGRQENPRNTVNPPFSSVNETANFSSGLSKTFANGGRFRLSHDIDYLKTNANPVPLFPSTYSGSLSASYVLPLWAGSGAEFTRIAGPIDPNFQAIAGVSQGVSIARINTDISLADFEMNVRNMLRDVESAYWDLYLAYCLYDATATAHASAKESWRVAHNQAEAGFGQKEAEPQARDRFYETRSQLESSLSAIYKTEASLRRLMGLSVNDGRILRPANEPTTVQIVPDWSISLAEGLTHRTELRRQKWNIKSLELQLKAARSLTKPTLNLVSSYQVNGMGGELIDSNDDDGFAGNGDNFGNMYGTMTQGDHTGWSLGLQFNVPLGFRRAHAQVRNYELRLARAREVLKTQEVEISHELAQIFQQISENYHTAKSSFNRLKAAERREEVLRDQQNIGRIEIDPWLRAQESVALAKRNYCQSLIEYNKALMNLQYYKGTLLNHYNVHLAEGGWEPKAYQDAMNRALERTNGIPTPYKSTEPAEFSYPWNPYGASPQSVPFQGSGSISYPSLVEPAPAAQENLLPNSDPKRPSPMVPDRMKPADEPMMIQAPFMRESTGVRHRFSRRVNELTAYPLKRTSSSARKSRYPTVTASYPKDRILSNSDFYSDRGSTRPSQWTTEQRRPSQQSGTKFVDHQLSWSDGKGGTQRKPTVIQPVSYEDVATSEFEEVSRAFDDARSSLNEALQRRE